MGKVVAGITMSLDGFVTGPNDRLGAGLGDGGERLHYWVFGGPWTYDEDPGGSAQGVDKAYVEEAFAGALEDEFGIEIPDEEAEKITTVQLAVDYAMKNQKA